VNQQSAAIFNRSWNIYAKVVKANHMKHFEFQECTKHAINQFINHPFSMLDLGCGDASSLKPILKKAMLTNYLGIDLSLAAIQLAKKNLLQLEEKVQWLSCDLNSLELNKSDYFDLVYSSFAIHHLLDQDKAALFKLIFEQLKPGGIFIYIDAYQKFSTGLDAYRKEYSQWIDDTWHALSSNEKQEIKNHLCSYDFPSTQTWINETLVTLGFELLDSNFEDSRHFYSCYQKV